jgi:hypothetical protein
MTVSGRNKNKKEATRLVVFLNRLSQFIKAHKTRINCSDVIRKIFIKKNKRLEDLLKIRLSSLYEVQKNRPEDFSKYLKKVV